MRNNEKARPAGSAAERAAETESASRADTTSNNQYRVNGQAGQAGIAGLLMEGRENGLHLRDLVKLTDYPERDVRRLIEAERRAGVLIVSDNQHGYWLATSSAEAERFSTSMERRAREILRTARAIKEAAGID